MYMSVHSHNSQIENFLAVYYRTLRISYVKYLLQCYSKMDGVSGFRLKPSIVFGYSLFKKIYYIVLHVISTFWTICEKLATRNSHFPTRNLQLLFSNSHFPSTRTKRVLIVRSRLQKTTLKTGYVRHSIYSSKQSTKYFFLLTKNVQSFKIKNAVSSIRGFHVASTQTKIERYKVHKDSLTS